MADLSVAHRAALAQVIDNVPDRTLQTLAMAVSSMPGERARTLQTMLSQASLDRARRAVGLAALIPLFGPRADGVDSIVFPSSVLARLWKVASEKEPQILSMLDADDQGERDVVNVNAACARLCAAAASALRDQPETVWPAGLAPAQRAASLEELTQCCDLGALASQALPSLKAWVGRPDGDQVAELRLLVRDAAAIAPDGARCVMDILFGHLPEAAQIVRLVVHSSNAASLEGFVRDSEMAVFVDRLIAALQVRAARIAAFKAGEPIADLKADMAWCAAVIEELDVTLRIHPDGVWGKQTRDIRAKLGKRLGDLFGGVEKSVDRVLPMAKVQTSGRMTRNAPKLDEDIDPATLQGAVDALEIVRTMRTLCGPFGCESKRLALMQALPTKLLAYGDLAIDDINSGEVADEVKALDRVTQIAEFLEQIEAAQEARSLRRRVAVAGGRVSTEKASSQAA